MPITNLTVFGDDPALVPADKWSHEHYMLEQIAVDKVPLSSFKSNDLQNFYDALKARGKETSRKLRTLSPFQSDELYLLRDPRWKARVMKAFSKTPYDFNIYFIVPRFSGNIFPAGVKIPKPNNYSTAINVVIFHNVSGNRLPLTPWIVAHRAAHAMQLTDPKNRYLTGDLRLAVSRHFNHFGYTMAFNGLPDKKRYEKLVQSEFDPHIAKIAKEIATFRSAREGIVNTGLDLEADFIVQYLFQGKAKLLRPEWLSGADEFEADLNTKIDAVLKSSVGKMSKI